MEKDKQISIVAKTKPLTAEEVKAHVNLITSVMASVMKPKVHYDTLPGTSKPTLLKPGAEKILTTFRIACIPEIEDLSTTDEIRYRLTVKGVHQTADIIVGAGVGECSSNEDKYKWRGVVCEQEWEATDERYRRTKWNKGYGNKAAYSVQQVRTNPADLANTILKMAKKRAMVDLCLTATAASDVFDQDLDELPPEVLADHQQKQKQANSAPKQASGNANKPVTTPQCKLLRAKLNNVNKQENDLSAFFKIKQVEELSMGQMNDAIAWIEGSNAKV